MQIRIGAGVKLATRISLFFLAALALILTGFCVSIYALVRTHLYSQFEARSASALETLTAAIESSDEGLEWEISERNINLGLVDSARLYWTVFDEHGSRVDGSTEGTSLFEQAYQSKAGNGPAKVELYWQDDLWRVSLRDVRATHADRIASDRRNPTSTAHDLVRYPKLILAVGSSINPVFAQLRTLALVLVALSASIWIGAALLGRWFCQKALSPLTLISKAISAMSVEDLHSRLSSTRAGDELDELSSAFNLLLDRLQTSFELQRRFASDASHQLRTPLTALQGQVEVALRRDRSSDEYRQTLVSVNEQAANLRKIVEMLLALTREPLDNRASKLECFELNRWLSEHVLAWRQHPRFGDLRVDTASTQSLWVTAHCGLLGQVVDNLWDNACKYSKPASPISITTASATDDIKLIIEDDGIGIAEQEIARIADPFYRSDEARSRGIGGTGLGLAIVKRIVSAIGGRLVIESVVGKGSAFTIVFPTAAR
jgi:two-component system OmpR family sensor kinase